MNAVLLITTLLNVILGFVIYKNSRNAIQRSFSYVTFLITVWVFSNYLYFQFPKYPYVNFSYCLGAVAVFSISFWLLQFVKDGKFVHKLILSLLSLIAIVSSLIENFVILSDEILPYRYGYNVIEAEYFWVFAVPVSLVLLYIVFVLGRIFIQSTGIKRVQLSYIFFAFSVPAIIIIILDFILPYFDITSVASLDSITTLLFIGLISYPLFKNRLLDIRIVIRKSIIQIVIFAVLFGFYAYILLLTQRSSSEAINLNNNTTLLFVILIIAATIEPLRRFIYKWIDNLFESKERNREESLRRMQLLSASNIQFEKLQTTTCGELSQALGAPVEFSLFDKDSAGLGGFKLNESIIALLKNEKIIIKDEIAQQIESGEQRMASIFEALKNENIAVLIPVGKGEEMLGAYIVKGSDTVFTSDMVAFMKEFTRRVEFAFASSLAYKYAIERIKI